MPILSRIGRRRPGHIAVRSTIYLLLTLGAISIIYPMLIVLGQTLSNKFDLRDNAIIPYYLRDRNELLLKHIYAMSGRVDLLAARHHRKEWKNQASMREDYNYYKTRPDVIEREQGFNLEARDAVLSDFNEFKASLDPDRVFVKSFRVEDYFRPFLFSKYRKKADDLVKKTTIGSEIDYPDWFRKTFPDARTRRRIWTRRDRLALALMNHELNSSYLNFYSVEIGREGNWPAPFWRIGKKPKDQLWSEFKEVIPPEQRMIVPADAYWQFFLKMKYRNIDGLNAAWKTDHESILLLEFPFTEPDDPAIAETWREFMTSRWPRRLMTITGDYTGLWREYVRRQLHKKFQDAPDTDAQALREISRLMHTGISNWEEVVFPQQMPRDDTLARYWCEFTTSGKIQISDMQLISPKLSFRKFLQAKYTAIDKLNQKWKTSFNGFTSIPLPLELSVYVPARFRPWELRWSFVTESYERVVEYLFGKGRAAQNTLLLVLFSLISALTINPIAAYSLSRFPMKHSTKILIFFLATMAFPPEVAMIPNFLLLRDLGLLNTFAALIFPRMANGFAIFLLKGFFDSLPRELFEAAEIDGASEIQVFRLVAMPLVKPILAYIGLQTFVLAYSSFMWAFVICPKQEMWTLMVWVYDFQSKNAGNNYVMAATVLVCIPPLIVFFFVNRIIMRGIVIPSMK